MLGLYVDLDSVDFLGERIRRYELRLKVLRDAATIINLLGFVIWIGDRWTYRESLDYLVLAGHRPRRLTIIHAATCYPVGGSDQKPKPPPYFEGGIPHESFCFFGIIREY